MTRFYDKAAWLLSSLGIALLVCGLVLVPQNRLLAAEPDPGIGCFLCDCAPAPPAPCIERICNLPTFIRCEVDCFCDENFLSYCVCYAR